MKQAGVAILPGLARDVLPALACVDRLRIECAVHGGHRVGKRILVDSHHGVAALDRQGVRRECRAIHHDRVNDGLVGRETARSEERACRAECEHAHA